MTRNKQLDAMETFEQPQTLVQFFRESPLAGVELDLERDDDTGREVEL
jgi:hypothetical protein